MIYYKLITDPDIDFQVRENGSCDDLTTKSLYKPYTGTSIDCLELNKRAKITDILSTGTLSLEGLIVNSKVYNIFNIYNDYEIQYVNITGVGLEDYKFMFFNGDLTNYIDYVQSDFKVVEKGILKAKILDIDVPQNRDDAVRIDIEECSDSIFNKFTAMNGYHFLPDFNLSQYDIFRIGHYDLNFYISEKVKVALQESNITGIECVEVNFASIFDLNV